MSGLGNPVALQANFTVDPLRTVKLLPGCREEITGGTGKKRKTSYKSCPIEFVPRDGPPLIVHKFILLRVGSPTSVVFKS